VAPVLEPGARRRSIYLPAGAEWRDAHTGARYRGGRTIELDAPLDRIAYLIRGDRSDPAA
jgi:alpha-D-xyloside xylohydrolase